MGEHTVLVAMLLASVACTHATLSLRYGVTVSFRQRLRVLVPCITVCSDEAKPMGEHTKFYDMRVKKLKEMQALGIITVKYYEIANMVADLQRCSRRSLPPNRCAFGSELSPSE